LDALGREWRLSKVSKMKEQQRMMGGSHADAGTDRRRQAPTGTDRHTWTMGEHERKLHIEVRGRGRGREIGAVATRRASNEGSRPAIAERQFASMCRRMRDGRAAGQMGRAGHDFRRGRAWACQVSCMGSR
jgi:hypothetical protein